MTSIIKVNNIHSSAGNSALTIASNGDTTFNGTVTGAGSMVKLLDATISSAVSEYDITSTYITSSYDTYMVQAEFLPATDNVYMYMRVFVGGAVQTGSIYGYETAAMSSSAYDNQDSTTRLCSISHGQMGNATGEGTTINAYLQNVNSTSRPFAITGMSNIANTGATPNSSTFAGQLIPANAANVVNGLSLYMSGGNIASGTVKLYGIN